MHKQSIHYVESENLTVNISVISKYISPADSGSGRVIIHMTLSWNDSQMISLEILCGKSLQKDWPKDNPTGSNSVAAVWEFPLWETDLLFVSFWGLQIYFFFTRHYAHNFQCFKNTFGSIWNSWNTSILVLWLQCYSLTMQLHS